MNSNLIIDRLDKLEAKLDLVIRLLENQNTVGENIAVDCKKMSTHIDDVHSVYSILVHPLRLFCSNLPDQLKNK